MPDREKVISGLQRCRLINKVNCDKCPYDYNGRGNGKSECTAELAEDALAMLKEQEKKIGEWIYKHDNLWYCSRCGEIIYSETDDDLEIHHAYCSRCGANMKQEGR